MNGVPGKLNIRQELADMRGWLAAEYADINSSLIKVLMIKPEKWKENCHNGEVNSHTAPERIWHSTKGRVERNHSSKEAPNNREMIVRDQVLDGSNDRKPKNQYRG